MDTSINALERALSIRRQIDTLENRLDALLGRTTRARWARFRAGKGKTAKKGGRRRGGITAAGRRRLSQLMKARWAARRRAQKK